MTDSTSITTRRMTPPRGRRMSRVTGSTSIAARRVIPPRSWPPPLAADDWLCGRPASRCAATSLVVGYTVAVNVSIAVTSSPA
ncbi:MAG TPA: hypothetical protein VJX10_09560, partial [Pseudonocardiaceae bacterium]|nr:hypothetical protein [Pseudonocardiaceae bacterium]